MLSQVVEVPHHFSVIRNRLRRKSNAENHQTYPHHSEQKKEIEQTQNEAGTVHVDTVDTGAIVRNRRHRGGDEQAFTPPCARQALLIRAACTEMRVCYIFGLAFIKNVYLQPNILIKPPSYKQSPSSRSASGALRGRLWEQALTDLPAGRRFSDQLPDFASCSIAALFAKENPKRHRAVG